MKRILCTLLACALCTSFAVSFSGCGCDNNQEPGYRIEATEPDLTDNGFGYFVLDAETLMVTEYTGTDKNIKIPDSYDGKKITTIGRSVFNNAEIENVEMPDTITEIQDYAFAYCKSLKTVKLSNNLEVLGANVFYRCTNLESIEIPASVKDLGLYTFSASGIRTAKIEEGENLRDIREFVFYQCLNLTEVTIPKNVTGIKNNAFEGCPNTVSIIAPEGCFAAAYARDGENLKHVVG